MSTGTRTCAATVSADLWENATPARYDGYLDHELTNRAVKFVSEHASGPFFLEVSYGAPHWPFQSPRRASTAARKNGSMLQQPADADPPSRKDYAEIVEELDAGVGRILEALSARGLAETTLVVFVSDNGGEWLSRNAPFFHRKDTVWEGGIRVPAIVRWPAALPAGRTLDQVAITMDLSATFVALAGGSIAAEPIRGHRSAADPPRGGAGRRADALLARGPGGGAAARGAERRLEIRPGGIEAAPLRRDS